MRVLTTWMYFEPSQIETREPYRRRFRSRGEQDLDPGVGAAWFPGETASLMPISNLKAFRPLRELEGEAFHEERLALFVDLFLGDADEGEFLRPEQSPRNASIVDYVLSQPIIIERSPPVGITLKGLINTTNLPIWIGTYMGWSVVPDHSVLLFITIPGGIVVVSSATGLALALSAGLAKSVKRLFSSK
jgi:hypothetical protein